MKNKKIKYENDEKKSIIIALIVSAVVIIAIVLACFAVKKHQNSSAAEVNAGVVSESEPDQSSSQGSIVVANQQELDEALNDMNTVSILFQTEEEQEIVIPEHDYRTIEFFIDAPYTNVTNNGIFSKITIYKVDSNTWTENATGNSFLIDSSACHMVINGGALVKSIEHVQDGSTLAIESQGTIELLALEADSAIVSLQTDGVLRQLQIYKNTNLKLSGNQTKTTAIEIEYGADGAVLNCSVPARVSSFASATLLFAEGAEGSELTIKSTGTSVQVNNETTDFIKVTDADGTESKVEASETFTFATESGSGEEEQSSSNASGTSTSQSSSSSSSSTTSGSGTVSSGLSSGNKTYVTSGYSKEQVDSMIASAVEAATKDMLDQKTANAMVEKAVKEATEKAKQEAIKDMITQEQAQEMIKDAVKDTITQEEAQKVVEDAVDSAVTEVLTKPMIVSFTEESPIYAGVEASLETGTELLPTVENLALPEYVYGHTFTGDVYKIPVISWQNLDQYSQSALAGTYRFAAILQTIPECNVAGGVRAVATVYVKPSGNETAVTYKDKNYESTISVREIDVIDIEEALIGDKVSYYYITNNSNTEVTYVALNFFYYDEDGRIVEDNTGRWYGRYLQPGESYIAYRENPCMDYAGYFVEVDALKSGMEPAKQYCEASIYYLDERGEPVEGITNHLQIKLYKKETDVEISQCSVTLLYIGLDERGQRVVLGADTISTGRGEVISINGTAQNNPLVLDIVPPGETVEVLYTVTGGYTFVENIEDADDTETTEKIDNTESTENTENNESTDNTDNTTAAGNTGSTDNDNATDLEQTLKTGEGQK